MTSQQIIPLPFVLLDLESAGRKGKKNYKSLNISITRRAFHSFGRAIFWRKNKILIKNSRHKLWANGKMLTSEKIFTQSKLKVFDKNLFTREFPLFVAEIYGF